MSSLKIPPHSEDAEKGVLGSVLLDPTILPNIELATDEFYDRRHQVLWDAMRKLGDFDALTFAEYLKKNNLIDRAGGYDYLAELQDAALVPSHSKHYADIVADKAKFRKHISLYGDALENAYKERDMSDSVVTEIINGTRFDERTIEHVKEEWHKAKDGDLSTLPTPFPDLDRMTGGLRRKMHTVVCGRSGCGKSMFFAQWYNYLGERGYPILVMPFEDKYDVTITRMAANYGRYNWARIQNGGEWKYIGGRHEWDKVRSDELRKAEDALNHVSKYPVHFLDRKMPPEEIMHHAVRYKAKYGIQAVFIDGAKDILRPSGKYSDTGFDEEISQHLCTIAERCDIATVSVYHLTKIPDGETITANHIRGSGNIVSDARAVYALQSKGIAERGIPVNHDEFGNQTTRVFELVKANHSRLGHIKLETDLSKCLFYKEEI